MSKLKIGGVLGLLLAFSLACSLSPQMILHKLTVTATPIAPLSGATGATALPPTFASVAPASQVPASQTPVAATATPTATFTPLPSATSEPFDISATFTAVAQVQAQQQAPALAAPSYSEQIAGVNDFAWGLDNSFWVATESTLYADPAAPIDTGDWINDAVFVSPDGSIVASLNTQESAVRFYDAASGAEQRTLPWTDHAGPVLYGVVFSTDWSKMAWYIRATAQLMDPWTGELGPALHHEQFLETVALSPNGAHVATFQGGGPLSVWDTETGDELARLEPPVPAYRAAISPDLSTAALVGEANAVVVWDIASAQPLDVFAGRGTEITSLAFSPDGGVLAAAFDDGSIQTWDLETGAALESLGGFTGRIFKLRFSPNAPTLAGQTAEGTIWLWRAEW